MESNTPANNLKRARLETVNLTKVYHPSAPPSLDTVSCTFDPGSITAVIGPSGAGKSTFLRCINRLVEPTSGSVFLSDINLCQLSPAALRRQRRRIGMIFQDFALVDRLTVMENVLSGRLWAVGFFRAALRLFPQDMLEEAHQLLHRVGLADYLSRRADALSGGQRQRVGIARALFQKPEWLLVDEPTASLDPKTSRQILRLIQELAKEQGIGVILNIHDVALAQQFVDRMVGLKHGQVVFDGPPTALTPEILTTIYGQEDWNQSGLTLMNDKAHADSLQHARIEALSS